MNKKARTKKKPSMVVCEKANRCSNHICKHRIPHEETIIFIYTRAVTCTERSRCIYKSKVVECVPVSKAKKNRGRA